MYYIGLDVHKKTISYCIKDVSGKIHAEGTIDAVRLAINDWLGTLPQPWTGALEATMFTGWIYDYLKPHASAVKVAHPAMLRAIAAAKKKNDEVDARMIADLLRCNLLPECYMAPSEFRERRRTLRYRNLLVRQGTQMKNRTAGLLMETGVTYNKEKLHRKGYFAQLRKSPESARLHPTAAADRTRVDRTNRPARPHFDANPGTRSGAGGARRTLADDSLRGTGDGTHLGAGGRRGQPVFFCQARRELLRAVQRGTQFSRDPEALTDLQAAQQASANGAGGSRETLAALQPRAHAAARKGAIERKSQSRHDRRGQKAGGYLLAVDRRETDFREGEESTEAA